MAQLKVAHLAKAEAKTTGFQLWVRHVMNAMASAK
jgi:hypothetical protein